jgi:pimeloyl-ACP methyl ester carboxylesterase
LSQKEFFMRKALANIALATVVATAPVAAQTAGSPHGSVAAEAVKNVVLVHGAFTDGSGWRRIYEDLTARGYRVTVVQNPLTSLADDVAATRRALDRQDGPAVLVGHSWGGDLSP